MGVELLISTGISPFTHFEIGVSNKVKQKLCQNFAVYSSLFRVHVHPVHVSTVYVPRVSHKMFLCPMKKSSKNVLYCCAVSKYLVIYWASGMFLKDTRFILQLTNIIYHNLASSPTIERTILCQCKANVKPQLEGNVSFASLKAV